MKKLIIFTIATMLCVFALGVSSFAKEIDATTEADISESIKSASTDDILDIKLTNDIEITNNIVIDKKITVNIHFNGYQLNYTGSNGSSLSYAGLYINNSKANVNLFGNNKLENYSEYTHYEDSIKPDFTGTGNLIIILNGRLNINSTYMLSSSNAFSILGDMVDDNDYVINIENSVLRAPENSSFSAMAHEGGNSSNNSIIGRILTMNNSVLYGGFKGINYAYNLTVGTSFTNVKFYDFYIKNDCWYNPDNANVLPLLMNSYERSADYRSCIFRNYDETVGNITIYTETGKQNLKLIECSFGSVVSGGKFSGDKGGAAIVYIIDKMPACDETGTMKVCTNGGALAVESTPAGEHVYESPRLSYPNGYSSKGVYIATCTKCETKEEMGELAPEIFVNYGFSISDSGNGVSLGTSLNKEMRDRFLSENPDISLEYGVVVGLENTKISLVDGKIECSGTSVHASFTDPNYSKFITKLTNIAENLKTKKFAFEFYISDGISIEFADGSFNLCSYTEIADSLDETKNKVNELLESKHKLYYNDDGSFRVMVVADVHMNGNGSSEYQKNLETMVSKVQPNLVIFTGDNTIGANSESSLRTRLDLMVGYLEENKIPWCHVFGNHDREGGMSNRLQQAVYESYEYCISKSGPEDVSGVGNYVLGVYNKDNTLGSVIYLLDSGTGNGTYSYDYIQENQIEWYKETSQLLQEYNGGEVVPGIMAFHIPLIENQYAYDNRNNTSIVYEANGERNEAICPSSKDTELFETILERGDVKAIVTGHDHDNTYMYNYYGVKLCSAPTISPMGYQKVKEASGCRVFDMNTASISQAPTYIEYIIERINPDDFDALDANTTLIDAETPFVGVASGLDSGNINGTATVSSASGKGYNGSSAIEVVRSSTGNFEFYISLENEDFGKLGTNKYLIVWADFTDVNFRKACFGLISEKGGENAYRTDDYDQNSPFYYLADGTDEWVTYSHGKDGCFGTEQSSSVLNHKGYFAIPIEYFRQDSAVMNENTLVTGFYMYADVNTDIKTFYLDNIMLVENYLTAELPTK